MTGVRTARRADRRALIALGHAPAVAEGLAPSLPTRLAWWCSGVRATTLVALEGDAIVGSVQFVRARGDTWMFGHWRVSAARRRRGLGRHLLERGAASVRGLRRLYSYVDWGNEASVAAHRRLGFEAAAELHGTAPLGALSTIGPAAPGLRFEPATPADGPRLAELYRRALGPVWTSLFAGGPDFLPAHGIGIEGPPVLVLRALRDGPARIWMVRPEAEAPESGFLTLFRRSGKTVLYADAARCDAGLLAKVAGRLVGLGLAREQEIELRGLSRDVVGPGGPIRARVLMGMPDAARLAAAAPAALNGAPRSPSLHADSSERR